MKTLLAVNEIKHAYGKKEILKSISFSLEQGEIACLLGPSGSGKTTILRCIAGFEDVLAGEISLEQNVISQKGWALSPEERNVGMIFQDYALFPHLTARQNIEVGLTKLTAKERNFRTNKWIDVVGLSQLSNRYPHELSGGEAQRVAIARSLAPQPSLLLLDEPFSSLDVELREHLVPEVRRILKENNMTALMVTHDQNEAFNIADTIGVFQNGRIEQWGSPYDLYHEPNSRFVADFIGKGVFIQGKVINEHLIRSELGDLSVDVRLSPPAGTKLDILFRPDDVLHDDDSPMQAKVIHKAFRGAYILYTLELGSGQKLLSYVPSHHNHAINSHIGIRLEADHIVWFRGHPKGESH